jgi:hypothetical protein
MHAPALQISSVQNLVSAAHAVPVGLDGCVQAPEPLQMSLVQKFPSSLHTVP